MIKRQIILGLLSTGVALTVIFSKLNNWGPNNELLLLGLVILLLIATSIFIFKTKGQRLKTAIFGLLWIWVFLVAR